jgi:DNA polymerase elongation subunit (family B)
LKNEEIIAASLGTVQGEYKVIMSYPDNHDEYGLLKQVDEFVDAYQPEVIIGYNHVSYDITLINTKLVRLSFARQLFNLKYFFGTSYLLDMMYVCALDMRLKMGEYKLNSLKNVLNYEIYSNLDLMRVKGNVAIEGMNPAEAVEFLWKMIEKSL